MAYNIIYKKSVQHDLNKLSRPQADRLLDQIERELSINAAAYPVLKGRFAGLRKYRVGDHRIIFANLGEDVLILSIFTAAIRLSLFEECFGQGRLPLENAAASRFRFE